MQCLDYALEKLGTSLVMLHYACEKNTGCNSTFTAFAYGIKSYLILTNMLMLCSETGLYDRLLAMEFREFRRWLEWVKVEGCMIESDPTPKPSEADIP